MNAKQDGQLRTNRPGAALTSRVRREIGIIHSSFFAFFAFFAD